MQTRSVARRATRGFGLLLVWVGGTLLLYVAWLLWFTGVETAQAQQELLAEFEGIAGSDGTTDAAPDADAAADGDASAAAGPAPSQDVDLGEGVALLAFERPGSDDPPVLDEPVVVVEGTSQASLAMGPGHYVDSADPGGPGNFAVAAHRNSYGGPFYHLDQLRPGDLVHVTGRDGVRHTYAVVEGSSGGAGPGQHLVAPDDTWVLGDDTVDSGGPVLTMTTCHPHYTAWQRLVVFAQLVDPVTA